MNITKENTGELTATVRLELTPADYNSQVEKTLKDHQKKAALHGFRPGKVPLGVVKKMYGKAVLVDEINKLVSESVTKYIKEEKLDLLGEPLPNNEKQPTLNFETPENFEFYFDIASKPEVKLELSEKIKIDNYKIEVDNKIIEQSIEDIRARLGNHTSPEISGDGDMLYGKFEELESDGKVKDGGITHDAWISLNYIKDDSIRKSLIGLSKGGQATFNPYKATSNKTEAAAMLGIGSEEVESITSEFSFTINNISHVEPAELNEEFYKKAFPGATITNETELKEFIKKDIAESYSKHTDQKLLNDLILYFLKEVKIDLPVEFLKRWLLETSKETTAEQLDKDFDKYDESLKWQLIENKIITDGELKVSMDEVKAYYKNYVQNMFKQYGLVEDDEKMEARINDVVNKAMENNEEANKIFHTLYENKILAYLKSKITLNEKSISYEDFNILITAKQ